MVACNAPTLSAAARISSLAIFGARDAFAVTVFMLTFRFLFVANNAETIPALLLAMN